MTHTEFDKTIRNIVLIDLKICFDKALPLAVIVTVTARKVSKNGVISGPYFPVFGLNTQIYEDFSPNTGKYGPE